MPQSKQPIDNNAIEVVIVNSKWYYTPKQAAIVLGVSLASIYNYIYVTRRLDSIKSGNMRLIPKSSVDRFKSNRKITKVTPEMAQAVKAKRYSLGVSRSSIVKQISYQASRVDRGAKRINEVEWLALCDMLGIDANEF